MKASILALTISTALSANAFAQSTKVDIQAANAATHELIDQQMRDIDASVKAQLAAKYADAQPGDIAVIDDVVYEQQSNGTWAAVGTASAALFAGLLSTSSSSNSETDLPVNPVEGQPDSPIFDDNIVDMPTIDVPELPVLGTPSHPASVDPANPDIVWGKVEVQDVTYITKNGELQFAIYGGIVYDVNNYEPVAKISKRNDGKIYKVETANGGELLVTNRIKNGAEFTVTKADGTSVDLIWTQNGGIQIAGDIGQGPEGIPTHPDFDITDPELPIMGSPEHPISVDPANPDVKWGKVEVQDVTYITKNGELQFAIYDGIVYGVNNYEPVAKISKRNDGKIYKVETAKGGELLVTNRIKNGAEFTVTTADGTSVDLIWTQNGGIQIAGDIGQGPEGQPMHPDFIDGDFEMTPPIDHLPEFDGDNDYDNTHIQIADYRGNGEVVLVVNGEEVADIEYKDGTLIINKYDSTQGHKYAAKVQETPNGAVVAVRHNDDSGYSFFRINEEGVVTPVDKKSAQNAIQNIDRTKLQNIDQNKLKQVKAKVQNRLATLKK